MAALDPADTETELFTRADLAMYEVKKQGGNRVCLAEGEGFRFLGPGVEKRAPVPTTSSGQK
jgi:hypothetical protein